VVSDGKGLVVTGTYTVAENASLIFNGDITLPRSASDYAGIALTTVSSNLVVNGTIQFNDDITMYNTISASTVGILANAGTLTINTGGSIVFQNITQSVQAGDPSSTGVMQLLSMANLVTVNLNGSISVNALTGSPAKTINMSIYAIRVTSGTLNMNTGGSIAIGTIEIGGNAASGSTIYCLLAGTFGSVVFADSSPGTYTVTTITSSNGTTTALEGTGSLNTGTSSDTVITITPNITTGDITTKSGTGIVSIGGSQFYP